MNIQRAVTDFNANGYVIIENVIDPSHIEALRTVMLADVTKILERTDTPFNFNKGNIQQAPPPYAPYLFEDVLFNDIIIEIAEQILGGPVKNSFYSGNTALPGDHTQPVHPDTPHPVAGGDYTPTSTIVVNIPIVDMSATNGATQLWPTTHLDTTYGGDIECIVKPHDLERYRISHPPIQPTVKAGTVILRDMRLWHAGMPNHTPNPRPMIAMMLWKAGSQTFGGIDVPARSASFFQGKRIETELVIIPDERFNHIAHGESYGV
jgi:ectoine hydroxylase-related dioxygenase (phytanoyl-CoA dioxygenase family)